MKKLFLLVVLAVFVPAWAAPLWNGDFETGTTEGWWNWTPTGNEPNQSVIVQSDNAHSGTYAVQVWTASGDSTQLGQDVDWSPGVPVSISLAYEGTFWGGAGVTIQYKDADWQYIDYAYAPIYTGTGEDTGWQTFTASSGEGTWTAPAGTAHLSFKIEQWSWATSFFDDITVPEPATMIMLSLGGLALIRRRRA